MFLVGPDWLFFTLATTLENEEEAAAEEEAYYQACLFQEQDSEQYQGKPSRCLLIHLSLYTMHDFTSEVLQNLVKQNYFWYGYYY